MPGEILKRVVTGPLGTNCYIIADTRSGEAIVIDPGDEYSKVRKAVSATGASVKYVVNTHGHVDHCGADARFGVPVLIHRGDAPFVENQDSGPAGFVSEPPVAVKPGKLLEDGDIISAGSVSLEVIHTPGHSPGGICLRWRRGAGPEVVFTGDTIFQAGVGRTDLPGGSYEALMRSIKEKVLTFPDDTILYPGHGPSTTVGAEKKHNPFI